MPSPPPAAGAAPALTLLRHATVIVALGGQHVLVDPMLDPAGAREPIADSPEPRANPLVGLPTGFAGRLAEVTAAVVTHLHADHLDDEGTRWLAERRVPVFGQPEDLRTLADRGIAAREIGGEAGSLHVHRTGGRHGTGALADMLGPVSGVVLDDGATRVYVAGDTVRCDAFDQALSEHDPAVVVLNAGGARFLEGDPITMTASEVVAIAADHPNRRFVAVHMDAINHCLDTRAVLRDEIHRSGVTNVAVPEDGERAVL